MNKNDSLPQKLPIGLVIFGCLLILISFFHMMGLAFGYSWMCGIYNYWPQWLVDIRYCLSWFQRILEISAGIGLLLGSKVFRRIAIALAIFAIATLYWEHHYPGFLKICQMLDDSNIGGIFRAHHLWQWSFVKLSRVLLIIQCFMDIIFYGLLLVYLTRPSIKKYFATSP